MRPMGLEIVAAFLRPPPALITAARTPVVGRLAIHGTTVHFRTAPRHLGGWLRRIDRWIAYANSVVAERRANGGLTTR
jgi:hypothetical protein